MKYLLVLLLYSTGPFSSTGMCTAGGAYIPMPTPVVSVIQEPYSSLQKCEEAGTNWNHAGMTFVCLQAPQ